MARDTTTDWWIDGQTGEVTETPREMTEDEEMHRRFRQVWRQLRTMTSDEWLALSDDQRARKTLLFLKLLGRMAIEDE